MASGLGSAIRDEITKLTAPLAAAATDPAGPALLVQAIGHSEAVGLDPGLRAELVRIAALAQDLTDTSDDDLTSWTDVDGIFAAARSIMSAVRAIEGAIDAPTLAANAAGLGEELAERLVATYLRNHYFQLFRAMSALTLVTPADRADPAPLAMDGSTVVRLPWARDDLHVDRIAALLDDARAVLRAAYLPNDMQRPGDAHLAAEGLFPLLSDLAASLDLGSFVDFVPVVPEPPPKPPVDDDGGGGDEWPPTENPDEGPPPLGPADLSVFRRNFVPRFGLYLPRDDQPNPEPPRFGLAMVATSTAHPAGVAGFVVTPAGEFDWSETRGGWRLTFSSDGPVPALVIGPDGVALGPGTQAGTQIAAELAIERLVEPSAPAFVFGARDGTRVEIGQLRITAGLVISAEREALSLSMDAVSAAVVLTAEPEDGFLGSFVPSDGLRAPFDLGLRLSSDRGVELSGGVGLALTVPLSRSVGPVTLRQIRLGAQTADRTTEVSLEGSVAVRLGPIEVLVEGLGLQLRAGPSSTGGSFGPVDLAVGFRWPSGAGLTVAAGPVSGGGFVRYDEDSGRYSGAFELRLQQVNVRAVGVLDTRLPGGQRGFSLLVMLSARFTAGIQLGFGITLTGVGGLVGVNRRIDVDALRERFAAGTVGRILAPEDPLRDLPAVLTELSAIFPPADGVLVVGPTLQLQWVKLVTLDIGVFLEFPGPNRVVVLGTARASIAHPRAAGPLLRLRCDFVGVLDLAQRTFAFDAVLLDSRLMESFPITGGLMVRVGWGDAPYVLFSAGGFHPDFAPGSLVLPKTLTRLALSSGSPNDKLFLRLEGYFAITPNTVQFGAKVEVGVELGPFRAKGFLGFDALIRFEPFFFQISFKAGMRLEWRGRTLAGITVSGTLSGPGPVRFTGRACIEMLFFDICGSASFELGSDAPPTVNPVSSAVGVIAEELRLPANLRALADDPAVTVGTVPQSTPPILAPTGLIWEQTRAPLGLLLERFEGSPLGRAEQVQINGEAVSGEERDWFAPGSFAELSDAEALTRRSFERLPSGVRLAAGDDDRSTGIPHQVEVEEFLVPAPATPPGQRAAFEAPTWLTEAALVREGRSNGPPPTPTIVVSDEQWQVLDHLGQPLTTTNETQAHQLARAHHATAIPAGDLITMAV